MEHQKQPVHSYKFRDDPKMKFKGLHADVMKKHSDRPVVRKCELCSKIKRRESLSFKETVLSPVCIVGKNIYRLPCWVCDECDEMIQQLNPKERADQKLENDPK